jgi:hypothetical protein
MYLSVYLYGRHAIAKYDGMSVNYFVFLDVYVCNLRFTCVYEHIFRVRY